MTCGVQTTLEMIESLKEGHSRIPDKISNCMKELIDDRFGDHVLSKGEMSAVAKHLVILIHEVPVEKTK